VNPYIGSREIAVEIRHLFDSPNGTLFGDGISGRIKEELLRDFNLHTIVRLPQGVFAPYTDIPANLIFFDRLGPTRDIWYYELPPPEGRKKYSKTAPIQFEEFADCLDWWNNREENAQAWRIDFAQRNAEARAKAEPFWRQAEQEQQAATDAGKQVREIDRQLNGLTDIAKKTALQDRQKTFKARQRQHEDAQGRATRRRCDLLADLQSGHQKPAQQGSAGTHTAETTGRRHAQEGTGSGGLAGRNRRIDKRGLGISFMPSFRHGCRNPASRDGKLEPMVKPRLRCAESIQKNQ